MDMIDTPGIGCVIIAYYWADEVVAVSEPTNRASVITESPWGSKHFQLPSFVCINNTTKQSNK